MTNSAVREEGAAAFRPWTRLAPLRSLTPILRGADHLRQTLIPSLLEARRTNETLSNERIELFEVAKVYLLEDSAGHGKGPRLPREERMLGLISGRDFRELKGVVEAVVRSVTRSARLEIMGADQELLDAARSCTLCLDGVPFGILGEVSEAGQQRFGLHSPTTIAELKLSTLIRAAQLIVSHVDASPYPAVSRDLNVVVDQHVRWADVEACALDHAGPHLESLEFKDSYRDLERLGADKKSLLFTITLRSDTGTLTREQADATRDNIVAKLKDTVGGELRA